MTNLNLKSKQVIGEVRSAVPGLGLLANLPKRIPFYFGTFILTIKLFKA